MALSALSSIALFSPIIASNVIFSARRATKGVDSLEEDPIYGIANMNIAGAQVLKGARAVKSLAIATDPILQNVNKSAKDEIVKAVAQDTKTVMPKSILKYTGKALDFTAQNINPVIVGTSAYNVITSDDKADTLARESTGLLTMFAAEEATKDLIGMPSFNTVKGKNRIGFRNSRGSKFAQNILSKEQYNTVHKFLNKNKTTRLAVASGKGLLFAGASIGGYKLGNKITDSILGEKKES